MFSAASKTGSQPSAAANYIEDVFSTYLYTGTSATQTINNGIDLAGKGGLTWIKRRGSGTGSHELFDTVRGVNKYISSNSTAAQDANGSYTDLLNSFNSNGFTLGADASLQQVNSVGTGDTYCSWTFREQAKFFDVVTWSGTGSAMTINHNLGSVPGMIIMKKLGGPSGTGNWIVWHRGLPRDGSFEQYQSFVVLNLTDGNSSDTFLTAAPTSSSFSINSSLAQSSGTYVAYLFAHNAGGFGTTGTDNVISCGSFTTDSSGLVPAVNLGYEPQYILAKRTDTAQNWYVFDVMREWSMTNQRGLSPNTSGAEVNFTAPYFVPSATGFYGVDNLFGVNAPVIYMAIRRPMKVPTTGTSVFSPVARTGNGSTASITGLNFAPDVTLTSSRLGYWEAAFYDRLRGFGQTLYTPLTNAESTNATSVTAMGNTSISLGSFGSVNASGQTYVNWIFARRPGFFDEVCYTGNSTAGTTQAHNLGVVPELMIVKCRSNDEGWNVYSSAIGNTKYLVLYSTDGALTSSTKWNNTTPTSSVFTLGTSSNTNYSGYTYVAYLFATCAGVSKVGSYTGNGTTQAISCGFTGGARFVLIKRTDSTGDWYVYDTARGMTTLTDPYLQLNSTAAETATLGSVTTTTGGFTVDASILAAVNTNAASYIFLAIA